MKVKIEEGNCSFEGEYSYSEVEGKYPQAKWYLYLRNSKTGENLGLAFYIENKEELDLIIKDLEEIKASLK
jgi:hypothetical protein